MITNKVRGDILQSEHKHIVFASNTEGFNDAGFAGLISRRFWPELMAIGEQKLGTVLKHTAGGKTFYAVVCHSLGEQGWKNAPETIEKALNDLDIPFIESTGESIASVAMGNGPIGLMQGADGEANMKAMEKSNKKIVVYSL